MAEHQETLFAEQDVQPSPYSHRLPEEDVNSQKLMIRKMRDKKLFQDAVQPMLVLASYLHHDGKGTELWADVGGITRLLMTLGLVLSFD